MKSLILIAVIFCFTSITIFAQHDHGNQQKQSTPSTNDTTNTAIDAGAESSQLSQLLTYYYNVKNALVADDAASASTNALAFVKLVNSIDYKIISEGNINTLANGAGKIADTKDIKKQRDYFANFSTNMAAVAKAVKLTNQPVYQAYCPMKKASWLSSEQAIKNPYYGSSMLTCGQITATLQ